MYGTHYAWTIVLPGPDISPQAITCYSLTSTALSDQLPWPAQYADSALQ